MNKKQKNPPKKVPKKIFAEAFKLQSVKLTGGKGSVKKK